jgi:HK97 family phage major capsid protein
VTAVAIGMTPHGMQKPEANLLGVTEKSYTIGTMAHYMVAHRQTLQDIPQLEGIINNALVFGLKQSEEVQLLYGNGTAPNLTGIMNNANIQNHGSFGTTAQANANAAWRFDHIRRALAKLQMVGGAAGGVMVHPMDWLEFELSKDTTARYIYATINQGAQQELLWRTPVVVSQAVRQGDFLVGDFNNGAYILDREDANVRFSDQHADFFTSNMIAILAEERIGLAVPRPQFFVKGNFTLS